MAFKDLPRHTQGVQLLQHSLERGRLAHAYLLAGPDLDQLELIARTLAKTLNCERPLKKNGVGIDCCDQCRSCRKIDSANHPDVHWVRPESKSRIVPVDQVRELMRVIQLKPAEAQYKVATIVAADRLRVEAANAFLKTLEEPPPKSVLILLTTDRPRILETILSRCLQLNFGGEGQRRASPVQAAWLKSFGELVATPQKSLLGRYRLIDSLLGKLVELKESIEKGMTSRSPLEQHPDAEKTLQDKWEEELKAAIEAEYRRQRSEWLALLQQWLRDVWMQTVTTGNPRIQIPTSPETKSNLLNFPDAPEIARVASRLSPAQALHNLQAIEELQQLLMTNVQEALALEVGLLKLHL